MKTAQSIGEELFQLLSEEDKEVLAKALGLEKNERKTQAQEIVEIALARGVELFHTPEGDAYATTKVGGHKETWPVTSRGSGPFRNWLRQEFYKEHGKPPGNQALQDAIGVLEAKAQFEGPEYPVFTRIAEHEDKIYLDLANENWEVVEISPEGWKVVSDPPVKFRRTRGMLPLPRPEEGGSIRELRRFVNAKDEETWILMVAWLIGAFCPRGPYPVLFLQGEQGSAKSTTARVLRSLIDPSIAPLRTAPKEERDLMIAATNSWVLAFDNLSGIPNWLSDAVCRLSTGAGFSTRMLYENAEETILSACRPVIANGIDELAARHDLLDRAIILNLSPIPEEERLDESTFWREFERVRDRILGALLDAVVAGLRKLPEVKLEQLPRMADFAKWVAACECALPWPSGAFLEAYTGNKSETIELAIEADVVATAVKELVEKQGEWVGTAQELLIELENYASEKVRKSQLWPKSARSLSSRLRRAATFLRQAGVEVEFYREAHTRRRLIRLKANFCVPNVPTVPKEAESLDLSGIEMGTQNGDDGDDKENFASPSKALIFAASTDGDAGDDKFPLQSKDNLKEETTLCRYCGKPIVWAQDAESGKWIACEPGYRGVHRCKKST